VHVHTWRFDSFLARRFSPGLAWPAINRLYHASISSDHDLSLLDQHCRHGTGLLSCELPLIHYSVQIRDVPFNPDCRERAFHSFNSRYHVALPDVLHVRRLTSLNRFSCTPRRRHPDILSVCTRQIERVGHDATSSEALETWFDAMTELRIAHHYLPECIYNMDESGFAVGASQSSGALVSVREKSS
jgi:hypothetical protein